MLARTQTADPQGVLTSSADLRTAELRPLPGPTALGGDVRRFAYLAATLAVTEFKLRFFGSVLGYLWQLMRPLLLFGVLYLVFTRFVRVGGVVAHYPVVLLMNIVLYTFFVEATSGAIGAVVDNENLVRKIQFPRLAIPVSVVLVAGFNLALNLLVVLVFALATGVEPRWGWLALPGLVAILGTLGIGLAMLLSAAYVRFRDVRPIWEVLLQAIFYATPVIYAIETVPLAPRLRHAVMANPLASILEQVRHSVIDPTAPTAAQAIGGALRLLVPGLIIVGVAVLGAWYFNREAPRIAEEL